MSCCKLEFLVKDDVAFESWWSEKSKNIPTRSRRSAKRYAYIGWVAAQEYEWRKRIDSQNSNLHSIISISNNLPKGI